MFTPCTVNVFIVFVVVPVFAAIILPQILHRALLASSLEKCTHTFDRLFHIFKVLCVCARVSYEYVRGEFVCVCARVSLSMCALASHKYARGEFVQARARLIWVCARRVRVYVRERLYVCHCAFHMYLFEHWLWRVNSLDIEIWNRTTCHFSILDSIEVIRSVTLPKKYRTRYPALHKCRMLEAISI